jgi:hypothetical protein
MSCAHVQSEGLLIIIAPSWSWLHRLSRREARLPLGASLPKPNPTTKLVRDKVYWLDRAEEARAIATEVRNPECRRITVEIAASYDRLARLAGVFQSAAMTPVFHEDAG